MEKLIYDIDTLYLIGALSDSDFDMLKEDVNELKERYKKYPPCYIGDYVYFTRNYMPGEVIEGKVSMLQCLANERWKIRITYGPPRCKSVFDVFIDEMQSKNMSFNKEEAEKFLTKISKAKIV